jgi:hypothetical protein
MSSVLAEDRRTAGERLQYFFWAHPEWWSLALCGAAWFAMLLGGHSGHEVHLGGIFPQELGYWMLMVAAMMLPLVTGSVWVTATSSLWRRRHRAIAGFVAGFFIPWLIAGLFAAKLRKETWTHSHIVPALAFFGSALWLLTAAHRRAIVSCHRTLPLAPTGWRADRDCLRFGAVIGKACVQSCWPLMLACAFSGHSLAAMGGGMAVGLMERGPYRPRRWVTVCVPLVLAGYYAFLAISSGDLNALW